MIAAKIRYLVVAGGAFPDGPPEANVAADIPAAQRLFAEWPTPIVASGHEIGSALRFPGASIDKEFVATSPDHPVADAYRAWRALPYDAPTGAMAAALYAGRAKEGYFQLSDPGVISAGDDGRTSFTASATGKHRYLILDSAEKDRILQDYVELASAKPVVIRRRFIKPDAEVNPAEEKKAADHGDEAVAPKPR